MESGNLGSDHDHDTYQWQVFTLVVKWENHCQIGLSPSLAMSPHQLLTRLLIEQTLIRFVLHGGKEKTLYS